jgi:DNA-binding NtrC family response regulator
LLESRSRVLEAADFTVRQATTIHEVEKVLTETQVDLLLLCHTLSPDDCQRAMAAAHKVDPKIPTVLLTTFSGRPLRAKMSEVVVHQMSGPRKLVETVRTILR